MLFVFCIFIAGKDKHQRSELVAGLAWRQRATVSGELRGETLHFGVSTSMRLLADFSGYLSQNVSCRVYIYTMGPAFHIYFYSAHIPPCAPGNDLKRLCRLFFYSSFLFIPQSRLLAEAANSYLRVHNINEILARVPSWSSVLFKSTFGHSLDILDCHALLTVLIMTRTASEL